MVEPRQAGDHRRAGIAATGIFKKRLIAQFGRLKGRKLAAHVTQIKRGQRH